jgi:hypothetical protein
MKIIASGEVNVLSILSTDVSEFQTPRSTSGEGNLVSYCLLVRKNIQSRYFI